VTPALCLVVLGQTSIVAGAEVFGEYFPRSSAGVPMEPDVPQQSVLTGGRLSIGHQPLPSLRLLGLFEAGYAAAGMRAGFGNDGFMVGSGFECDWVPHRWLLPFARLTYDARIAHWASGPNGTLADFAVALAAGARVLRFLDVHVIVGRDFAGGWSLGCGVGLGWSWAMESP